MAASSQDDDEDEERRALEQELAAELAALSAEDVELEGSLDGHDDQKDDSAGCVDRNGEVEMDYVRLDLDTVLKQVAKVSADELLSHYSSSSSSKDEEYRVAPTAWELLLQSVERSDQEFFQPYHENLHDIRTSILDVESSTALGEQQTNGKVEEQFCLSDEKVDQETLEFTSSQPEQTGLSPPFDEGRVTLYEKVDECKQECGNTKDEKVITTNSFTDNSLEQSIASEPPSVVEMAPIDPISPPPEASDVSNVHLSAIIFEEEQPVDDQAMQKELQAIAKQHEARELRRLKAQTRYEKERYDAAQRLLRLQEEFETQEKQAEISRREAQERSLMANEETRCRLYAAAEREAYETALMTLADEASRKFESELARIQDATSKEVAQMTDEDQAERHRMQVERQVQCQKQKALARCRFGIVLLDLVEHHKVQRQIRDQQTKRERRECVQMRAEEAYTRRVIGQSRALREQRERETNRELMIHEDKLSNALEDLEKSEQQQTQERLREEDCRECMEKEEQRTHSAWTFIEKIQLIQRENEEHCRLTMNQEDERCRCVWAYLAEQAEAEGQERERQREMQRLRILSKVSAGFQGLERGFRQHKLIKCLTKWKWWHEQCKEAERIQSTAADNAAKRIQMWHRSCRQQLVSVDPPLFLEDYSDDEEEPQVEEDDVEVLDAEVCVNSPVNQEAALRLQSTFRGFHVRRKFANALALAQAVDEHEEGDYFDAVDLDDLIQLPPELVDGWEDPVLPPTSVLTQRRYPQQIDREERRVDNVDNNEVEDMEDDRSMKSAKPKAKPSVLSAPATGNPPPKEQNLAATLWNKMKRVKQRQQHAQQERQHQQDPVYRVQKLLNRKPNARHNSSQNGNSSSSSQGQGSQKAPNLVSWSSTSSTKKKPKVKLPSLVERLRKQTMAER